MDLLNILPLLGLALRGGNLAVGEESVETAAQARGIRLLLLASDAPENTRKRAERFSLKGQCLRTVLPFSEAELGRALGRASVAMAAVTDIGLAESLGRKLALLDPEAYGELSKRLELKAKRARERRAERGNRKKPPEPGKREARDPPPKRTRSRESPCEKSPAGSGGGDGRGSSRPRRRNQGGPARRGKPNPYAHSRPVKKGKGSFRKREEPGGSRR